MPGAITGCASPDRNFAPTRIISTVGDFSPQVQRIAPLKRFVHRLPQPLYNSRMPALRVLSLAIVLTKVVGAQQTIGQPVIVAAAPRYTS
jgi:hypothetical protein